MLVAKLPGSTYATEATKAGPSIVSVARSRPRATSAWSGVAPLPEGLVGLVAHAVPPLDAHRAGERRAQDVHLAADADEERAVERLPLDELEPRAGDDAALAEEAEHLGLGVRDPDEGRRLAGLELRERRRRCLGELQLAARDRVAVRVDRRVAELRGDQLLELLRERVLEHLGLGVHLVPGHAEALDEEQLDEPVVADHLERDAPAALGEADAAVALVLDEAEGRELAQHPRDGGGADLEQGREVGRRGGAVARLERVDRLRVVLHGGGEIASLRRPKLSHA